MMLSSMSECGELMVLEASRDPQDLRDPQDHEDHKDRKDRKDRRVTPVLPVAQGRMARMANSSSAGHMSSSDSERLECPKCGETIVRMKDDEGATWTIEVASQDEHSCWQALPENAEHLRIDSEK